MENIALAAENFLQKITTYTLNNNCYKMQNILVSFYHVCNSAFIQENAQALAQKRQL